MKTKLIKIAATALLITASAMAHATLEPRLSGMAYYDTDTGLTWAAPENVLSERTFFDQIDFLPTFSMGGTSDWRIPSAAEFASFVHAHSDHSIPGMYIPLPPLDTSSMPWGYFYWVTSATSHGDPYSFRPLLFEFFPSDVYPSIDKFKVWQVHVGDVPVIAIPEPSTYAMLLVGLGVLGFVERKKLLA